MAAILNKIGWFGAALAFGGAVVQGALYDVDGGHRAVIFDQFRGVSDVVRPEGTHFMIPVIQKPIIYDVRSQPRNIPVTTPSKDLQNVNITLRILYRPEVAALPWIFKNYGTDYAERVLPSIGHEILKAVVAQHDAAELITQREIVSMKCREALNQRAKDFRIILDDISITHLTFGQEFTHAVELKQVAQQEAERARFLVERAEQEKIANIIRAEGDSKAAKLISDALMENGTALIELRKIDAAKDIAATLSRSRNVSYLPGGKNLLLNMAV
eukprot:m.101053 g.101053  ORF g.101053 m.101053 type:complete len:272 (-) comp14957_c0_seq2:2165-2980(-)